MRAQVRKWGNSGAVRIPAAVMASLIILRASSHSAVMAAASLSIDQAIEVRAEDGRIIIEPVKAPAYALDDLLDRMTPATFPDDYDTGAPAGGEIW